MNDFIFLEFRYSFVSFFFASSLTDIELHNKLELNARNINTAEGLLIPQLEINELCQI